MFRRSPLIIGCVALAAGIACSADPAVPAIPGLFCHWLLPLALAIPSTFFLLDPSRHSTLPALLLFVTVCTVAGLLLGAQASALCRPNVPGFPESLPEEPAWFAGTVSGRPVTRFQDSTLIVKITHTERDGRTIPCSGRIRLGIPTPAASASPAAAPLPADGQSIRFFTCPRRPVPFDNPGRFNYLRFLAARRVSHTARLKSSRLIQPLASAPPDTALRVCRWVERTIRSRFIRSDAGGLSAPGAMLVACLTGNRRWIDPDDQDLLRCSGLGHLLAISGLHLGLLGVILSCLLSRCRIPILFRRLALICFFLFYLQLAGGTQSITRAVIMATVYLSGQTFGFRPLPGNSLAAAGLAILALNPLMIFDAGCQLSFGATASILILAPMFTRAGKKEAPVMSRIISVVRGGLAVSFSVFLGIAPLQASLFHRATPAALLTNLAAGPLLWRPGSSPICSRCFFHRCSRPSRQRQQRSWNSGWARFTVWPGTAPPSPSDSPRWVRGSAASTISASAAPFFSHAASLRNAGALPYCC